MAPIVPIAPGVFRIPTFSDAINTLVVVDDDGSVAVVDTGLKRASGRIVAGLAAIGKHPRDVQRIILTHAHNDHAGSAADLVHRTGLAGVGLHRADADYAEAGVSPPMNQQALLGRLFTRMSAGGFDPVPVAENFSDGQLLAIAGGLRVHHTPGHTPGHISLLHEPTGVLFTGDAIWNPLGRMTWPVAAFCTSTELNQQSAHVLGELDYRVAAFTHGPHIRDNARESIRGFLRRKGL
ncbi:MAG: MBL fold metallo-hydrolase [Actinomycetia bacterium]|nr:MBL fold metallo-hydrolase [Actinomycetes bacterium]